jgi:hypothetical protein
MNPGPASDRAAWPLKSPSSRRAAIVYAGIAATTKQAWETLLQHEQTVMVLQMKAVLLFQMRQQYSGNEGEADVPH